MASESVEQIEEHIKQLRSHIADLRAEKENHHSMLSEASKKDNNLNTKLKVTKELQGHFGKIYSMHWASDSTHLISASQDGKLLIWDAQTTNKVHMINLRSSWVMTCCYAPSMKFVACGGLDNLCSIYPADLQSAETQEHPLHELNRHEGYLSCCRFVDDNTIITSSGDATCILWDISKDSAVMTFDSHEADVMSMDIQENSSVFVSGSCDRTAKVWDHRVGKKVVFQFQGHEADINSVAFFPGQQTFGTGSDDSTCRLYDLRAYQELNRYHSEDVKCGVTSIDFSRTGKYLFCGYDDKPYCASWDTLKATKIQDLNQSNRNFRVSCLGVPDSGYCLCTGSWDNNLRIWAVDSV